MLENWNVSRTSNTYVKLWHKCQITNYQKLHLEDNYGVCQWIFQRVLWGICGKKASFMNRRTVHWKGVVCWWIAERDAWIRSKNIVEKLLNVFVIARQDSATVKTGELFWQRRSCFKDSRTSLQPTLVCDRICWRNLSV